MNTHMLGNLGGQGLPSPTESSPTIILKKGKTELKIENAAAIIKKIDDACPAIKYSNYNKTKQPTTDDIVSQNKQWIESARNWFKQEWFGDDEEEIEVVVKTPEEILQQCHKELEEEKCKQKMFEERVDAHRKELQPDVSKPIHSVNKNAYEIRADVLKMALDFIQFQVSCDDEIEVNSHEVLEIARKFYSFVENRR